MPTNTDIITILIFLGYAIILGFGFALGGWLWSLLLSAFRKG